MTYLASALLTSVYGQEARRMYLSGTGLGDEKLWDFYCSAGRKSGKWTKIKVPSCWEQEGFGVVEYGRMPKGHVYATEYGLYKHKFKAPTATADQQVNLVFDGSMTDTEVKVNGQLVGPKHQGSFYRFKYDISNLIKPGKENLLEVRVDKMSSDTSVNRAERFADYWIFGGIFRPVYLEVLPKQHLQDLIVEADMTGEVALSYSLPSTANKTFVELSIPELGYNNQLEAHQYVKGQLFNSPKENSHKTPTLWSVNEPKLYQTIIKLKSESGTVLYQTERQLGFRRFEVRKRDGLYLNGHKIMLKGINRQSFWPTSGRTTNAALSLSDLKLLKRMNVNAIRMGHYPPDEHFVDLCDKMGFLTLDELSGWQKQYDTEVGRKLVKEMVIRDAHHPSIVFWSNGNEGGSNHALVSLYNDLTHFRRHIIHPWAIFDGMDTQHYRPYDYGVGTLLNGQDLFMPTEFLHGLFDGGGAAGLKDYWEAMQDNPLAAGGFIWAFCDECLVRRDKNDSLDCQYAAAPDGIVGPYRELEGSFWAIRQIWSPLKIRHLRPSAEQYGKYYYQLLIDRDLYPTTPLKPYRVIIETHKLGQQSRPTKLTEYTVNDQELKVLRTDREIKLGQGVDDVIAFQIMQGADTLSTFSFPLKSALEANKAAVSNEKVTSKPTGLLVTETDTVLHIAAGEMTYSISSMTGLLLSVTKNGTALSFGQGPVLAAGQHGTMKLEGRQETEDSIRLTFSGRSELMKLIWTVYKSGLLKVNVTYKYHGTTDFLGFNFKLPESDIKSVSATSRGPYRVWKNRMDGQQFCKWSNDYNDTQTGFSFKYPEFKGYFANLYNAELSAKTYKLKVWSMSDDVFLRLYTPKLIEMNWNRDNTQPAFPSGDIGFMHAIPAMGEKFLKADQLGPSGSKNQLYSNNQHRVYLNTELYFRFD